MHWPLPVVNTYQRRARALRGETREEADPPDVVREAAGELLVSGHEDQKQAAAEEVRPATEGEAGMKGNKGRNNYEKVNQLTIASIPSEGMEAIS